MCEQTEISYLDGEVVWVKLGSCWWPGEVVGPDKLPPDVLPSFRKPPIAVVKFFQEDAYEYVKNLNSIYKYNCSRKTEFINKGLYMYRTKHGHMEKFPEDVIRAEAAVGGDITILTRDEFQETKKESYANLFGDPAKKSPMSNKKGNGSRGRSSDSSKVHNARMINVDKPNYKVHILLQGSPTTPVLPGSSETASTPSTSRAGSEPTEEHKANSETPVSTPSNADQKSNTGTYSCHACAFTTTRLNVLILHNKTHSVTFMPYTPTPVRKKIKSKSASNITKTPKSSKSRLEKIDKITKKSVSHKRMAEDKPLIEVKKTKTDEEIKISLLADWDIDEDSNDEESSVMVMTGSPEVAEPADSPAVAEPAELPEAQVPLELPTPVFKNSEDFPVTEKPETSSDSKYEFCEDEDWSEEEDIGRKIPRVKNPRKEDTKSISLDDDEVAREVAELLNKTTVPELPAAPEPLKVEENFPEPSIVKSPDKKPEVIKEVSNSPENKLSVEAQAPKTIFKTKTFFRSRHSRSQDAIGKYVAEQLNAERMDMPEDINGSEILSPETRNSPPVGEPIKVARLAPKIQLKKMKAEAAQMREKDKLLADILPEEYFTNSSPAPILVPVTLSEHIDTNTDNEQTKLENTQENENILEQTMQDIQTNVVDVEVILDQSQNLKQPDSECGLINMEVKSTLEPEVEKEIQVENELHKTEIEPTEHKEYTQNKEIEKAEIIEYLPKLETSEIRKEVFEQKPNVDETNANTKLTDDLHEHELVKKDEELLCKVNLDDVDHKEASNKNEKSHKIITTTIVAAPEIIPVLNQQEVKPDMNESTASAVDALLSVSRETDRVTKIISNDLPEDLFEDDNKDNESSKNHNGFVESKENNFDVKKDGETNMDDDKGCEQSRETIKDNINSDSQASVSPVINSDVDTTKQIQNKKSDVKLHSKVEIVSENIPSESDLVIAETLINLPSTTIQITSPDQQENGSLDNKKLEEETIISNNNVIIQNKDDGHETRTQDLEIVSNHITTTENIAARFETEHEKSENLNAAQSLVQMSESIEHNINIGEVNTTLNKEKSKPLTYKSGKDHEMIINKNKEPKSLLSTEKRNEVLNCKTVQIDTSSPKLLKILEEPCLPKLSVPNIITKQLSIPGKEKILNFDVGKSGMSTKSHSPKQKIIIRRSNTPHKNLLNNVTEATPDKIILSRSNNTPQDGSSVQTYTIQTANEAPSDPNTIVIQQKVRKIAKAPAKLQKLKSLVSPIDTAKNNNEPPSTEEVMFDINSMPIVLSEDILTPESIEKMPIVMSDGNLITNSSTPQKIVKPKQTLIENEKKTISPTIQNSPKQEFKTLIMNPVNEINKVTTPNILSKSSKLRGTKMLLIDKTSGKQKIIMTKQAPDPPVKEIKTQAPLMQPISQNTAKAEKFILVPTTTPRPVRTQKIVIDPQTGKAHMLVGKGTDSPLHITDNKQVSTKLVPSPSDGTSSGNTVMIITNAQGAQSRILLKPEHEKILFPNKQQSNVSQLKTITHRIPSNSASANKTLVTNVTSAKNTSRIVSKQKSTIITSKGQLIVGGRVATTAHNIAPMPEIRPAPKRIISNEPKKLIQTIQKNTSEPLIFFQQKSGAMMQLTAAQFDHLQRTGQIVQKPMPGPPRENKIMLQKTINISPNETVVSNIQKPRIRKQIVEAPTPIKKIKQEIPIAPAPAPMPALCPISNAMTPTLIPPTLSTTSTATASSYSNLENFEELLPSTAIARQTEPALLQPEQPVPPPALSDGQLLAVPGEHFGGPQGTFYLCVEDNGTFTPIDNRPLVLENNQLVPMPESLPALVQQPERRDILEAALANSDVFHGETARDEAPDFRDLNANVSVHCRVSETSTTLNQPIMTPVEVPTKADSEPAVPSNLEDGLAVIGVTPQTVPTSLELPITVTDPRIALKTTDPLSANNYGTSLLPSPNTEISFGATEVDVSAGGPISMPLLTEDESVGKSMPILTDDVSERIVSSVESTVGSPSPIDVRDAETEDGSQWSRRLLTSGSDTSEISAEIPLQPKIKLSVSDIK